MFQTPMYTYTPTSNIINMDGVSDNTSNFVVDNGYIIKMSPLFDIKLHNSSIKMPTIMDGGYLLYCPNDMQLAPQILNTCLLNLDINIPNIFYGKIVDVDSMLDLGFTVYGNLKPGANSNVQLRIINNAPFMQNIKKDTVIGKLVIEKFYVFNTKK